MQYSTHIKKHKKAKVIKPNYTTSASKPHISKHIKSKGNKISRHYLHNECTKNSMGNYLYQYAKEALVETLYPTRCAVCDVPGILLCSACRENLPYIDSNKSCKKCGAPWGAYECTECNPLTLKAFGLNALPLDSCACVTVFNANSQRIIHAYKDHGERRLSTLIAQLMLPYLHPEIADSIDAVCYISSSKRSINERGFNHMLPIAQYISNKVNKPLIDAFCPPSSKDQRKFGRKERLKNMKNVLILQKPHEVYGKSFLIVDDVMTTGATIYAASLCLKQAGATATHALCFSRV